MQGERGEARERVEQLQILLVEVARLPRADPENAANLAQPRDRCIHDLGEDLVVVRRRRGLGAGEVALEERAPRRDNVVEGALRNDLAANVPLGHAEHGLAPQHRPALVVDPAVGRVRSEELDDLGDQALDDRRKAQVGGEHLSGLEERGLFLEAAFVLLQELRGMNREPDLARDRLGDGDVVGAPDRGLRAVEGEDPDDPVEDQNRRGDDRAGAELDECVPASERRVVEVGRDEDVSDDHGSALARGEVRHGKPPGRVSDRLHARRVPLRPHRRVVPRVAEQDEGAGEVEPHPDLRDGDVQDGVEVELRADAPADLGDHPLALERLLEGVARRRVTERERRLVGQILHELGLGRGEEPRLFARHGKNCGHPAVGEKRDEGGAVRAHAGRELLIHLRRGLHVEDDEGCALAGDGDDPAPRGLEVQDDGAPPGLVDPSGRVARSDSGLLVDGGDHRLGHLEDALELVEEPVRSLPPAAGPRECGREPGDRLGVASAFGCLPFGLVDARPGGDEEVPLLPAPDEDGAGHERE